MNNLDNIVITDIEIPIVVHSKKGRKFQMTNRQSYGLSLCISGQITYTMNGENYISDQSNAVLLPQGGTYSLFGDAEGLFPVINFKCKNFNCNKIMAFKLENPQAFLKSFEALKNLFLDDKNHLKIYSVFYDLLSKIYYENSQKHTLLDSAIQFIAENTQNPTLSNTCIAKQIGISEVYLRKLFLSYYHITPKQYVLDIRIRKAKQLLCDTPFRVTAIAEECGFSSVYHFCRVFKEKTGFTPTEYANLNRIYQI
jgi:AraC-like DNA-binding protein